MCVLLLVRTQPQNLGKPLAKVSTNIQKSSKDTSIPWWNHILHTYLTWCSIQNSCSQKQKIRRDSVVKKRRMLRNRRMRFSRYSTVRSFIIIWYCWHPSQNISQKPKTGAATWQVGKCPKTLFCTYRSHAECRLHNLGPWLYTYRAGRDAELGTYISVVFAFLLVTYGSIEQNPYRATASLFKLTKWATWTSLLNQEINPKSSPLVPPGDAWWCVARTMQCSSFDFFEVWRFGIGQCLFSWQWMWSLTFRNSTDYLCFHFQTMEVTVFLEIFILLSRWFPMHVRTLERASSSWYARPEGEVSWCSCS